MKNIYRLGELDKIYDLTLEIEKEYGIKPLNLSNWQISKEYEEYILKNLEFERFKNVLQYCYSYTINLDTYESIKKKLGVNNNKDILISSNNTLSIMLISNFLKQKGCSKLCVIGPSYFSVYESLKLLNISYDKLYMTHDLNGFHLPNYNILDKYDYIWITSPIFSSGIYFKDNDLRILKDLQNKKKIIIIDEAYSYIDKDTISNGFSPDITILSPHKPLNINSLKFSVVIYNKPFNDIFIHWSDVIHGNLSISSIEAIHHYLSSNYEICLKKNHEFILNAFDQVKRIVSRYSNFYLDKQPYGNMIMIYNNKIKYDAINDINSIRNLMINTYGYILPSFFHDYNSTFGFCFRINLCIYDRKKFEIVLNNILHYLSTKYE